MSHPSSRKGSLTNNDSGGEQKMQDSSSTSAASFASPLNFSLDSKHHHHQQQQQYQSVPIASALTGPSSSSAQRSSDASFYHAMNRDILPVDRSDLAKLLDLARDSPPRYHTPPISPRRRKSISVALNKDSGSGGESPVNSPRKGLKNLARDSSPTSSSPRRIAQRGSANPPASSIQQFSSSYPRVLHSRRSGSESKAYDFSEVLLNQVAESSASIVHPSQLVRAQESPRQNEPAVQLPVQSHPSVAAEYPQASAAYMPTAQPQHQQQYSAEAYESRAGSQAQHIAAPAAQEQVPSAEDLYYSYPHASPTAPGASSGVESSYYPHIPPPAAPQAPPVVPYRHQYPSAWYPQPVAPSPAVHPSQVPIAMSSPRHPQAHHHHPHHHHSQGYGMISVVPGACVHCQVDRCPCDGLLPCGTCRYAGRHCYYESQQPYY